MSTSTIALPTGEETVIAPDTGADLWTSDSERGVNTSDAVPGDDAPEAPAAEVAASEPETSVEPAAAASAADRDDKGQFTTKKPKARDNPVVRMQTAVAKEAAAKEEARVAREENARLRAELDARSRPAAAPAPEAAPPARAGVTFPGFDQWLEKNPGRDYDDYRDDREEARRSQWWQSEQQRLSSEQQTATRNQRYTASLQAVRTKYQDAEAVFNQPLPVVAPPALVAAIMDSEYCGEIAYWIGTHHDQYAQLAAQTANTPVVAADWVRRHLEAQIPSASAVVPDAASVVRPSAARPPVHRVGGTASVTPADPDDLEFGPEYIRAENARERKQREAGRW